jgi:hypothetical protein
MQVLVEHAYTLYLGGRLPPRLLGGYEWPEEFPPEPRPEYLSSKLRGFTVRMPRHLARWARVYAAEADIPEQELAVRVFDWYVRTNRLPPNRESVPRSDSGHLVVSEPLLALEFEGPTEKQVWRALAILEERHEKFGGTLSDNPVRRELPKSAVEARVLLGLDKPREPRNLSRKRQHRTTRQSAPAS